MGRTHHPFHRSVRPRRSTCTANVYYIRSGPSSPDGVETRASARHVARRVAQCDNERWRKPIMFWMLLQTKKVSWTTKNVQGKTCLGTSFLTFSIEASAHPVSVS